MARERYDWTREILREEAYFDDYKKYGNTDLSKEISQNLNERKYTLRDTGQTFRNISHWSNVGLLSNAKDNEYDWRRFSIVDLFWIYLIAELREFGLSLKKIKIVCEHLFSTDKEHPNNSKFLEYYIMRSYFRKIDCFILVFWNGEATAATRQEIEGSLSTGLLAESYLSINFNTILKKVFGNRVKIPYIYQDFFFLKDKEISLVSNVRKGQFKSITTYLKGGKIERIENTQDLNLEDISGNLSRILKEHDFQEISLQRQNGKIVSIKRTIRQK